MTGFVYSCTMLCLQYFVHLVLQMYVYQHHVQVIRLIPWSLSHRLVLPNERYTRKGTMLDPNSEILPVRNNMMPTADRQTQCNNSVGLDQERASGSGLE